MRNIPLSEQYFGRFIRAYAAKLKIFDGIVKRIWSNNSHNYERRFQNFKLLFAYWKQFKMKKFQGIFFD